MNPLPARNEFRFTTGVTSIVLAAVIAVSLCSGQFWILALTIQIAGAAFIAQLLTNRLPVAIRNASQSNSFRLDGSKSTRREQIEDEAISHFCYKLFFIQLLLLVPSNVGLMWVHNNGFPLPPGLNAAESVARHAPADHATIHVEETQMERREKRNHTSRLEVHARKRKLRHYWQVNLAVGVAWLLGCAAFLKRAYLFCLTELTDSIEYRRDFYVAVDLARVTSQGSAREELRIWRDNSKRPNQTRDVFSSSSSLK